jgi:CheY-like chemotaxis protein
MDRKKPAGVPSVILLVEDNPDHTELMMRNLESERVANDVRHVADGQAALDYLFRRREYADPEQSPRPDVVLLDLRLPKIDGLQVLKEIKASEELRSIPVVVLTTSKAEHDLAKAYEHYVNSYVVKPLDFAKFSRLMNDLGFYWLAWNCHPRV